MFKNQALQKMMRYCAYQERCHQEVRYKLISMKVFGDELEQIMATLIEEGYLNEERFAASYVRGKHRLKKWGPNRLLRELKKRKVSDYCIRKAMNQIDEQEYKSTLYTMLYRYMDVRKSSYEPYTLYNKTFNYGISKGYEVSMVKELVRKCFDDLKRNS